MKKKKLKSIRSLKLKAWKLFSIYVRSKDADFQGRVACYTCFRKFKWQSLHAGHFIHSSYDFDERNVKPQCPYCNTYCHGKPLDFYLHLVRDYGQGIADALRKRAHWNDYKRAELMNIVEHIERYL